MGVKNKTKQNECVTSCTSVQAAHYLTCLIYIHSLEGWGSSSSMVCVCVPVSEQKLETESTKQVGIALHLTMTTRS